ncbi:MAG: fluoride efflux transporter CrcB [Cyanobacteria bacterium HKST-UBA02]|nr:fluoride efflux transporter CrcB [Cyanobacteria bacterium HKST-UBA02]
MSYLLIFLGAGLGGVFRFLVSSGVQGLTNDWTFPLGTMTVNILGCLLIGMGAQFSETRAFFSPEIRAFLMVGVLGGFTTFSTYGYETFQLIRDGQMFYAISNAVLQVLIGVACVYLGYWLAKLL